MIYTKAVVLNRWVRHGSKLQITVQMKAKKYIIWGTTCIIWSNCIIYCNCKKKVLFLSLIQPVKHNQSSSGWAINQLNSKPQCQLLHRFLVFFYFLFIESTMWRYKIQNCKKKTGLRQKPCNRKEKHSQFQTLFIFRVICQLCTCDIWREKYAWLYPPISDPPIGRPTCHLCNGACLRGLSMCIFDRAVLHSW